MTRGHDPVGDAVVGKLIRVMQLRDPMLADHARRTAEIATAIGAELGCAMDTLDRLYTAAQLHDIGKLGVSEAILWKPTGLDRSEWRVIRTHPEHGHVLVADSVERDVAAAVLYHHERMDGLGYPYGIDGRTLPLLVRVVQVADAFDAMTSNRPYQAAIPTAVAVGEIQRCAGSQFDPEVAAALDRMVRDRGDVLPLRPHREAPEPRRARRSTSPGAPTLIRLRDRHA
jgi:HD-GYP domain-containing protein (c-di-GMP phosphodiesterase class II)